MKRLIDHIKPPYHVFSYFGTDIDEDKNKFLLNREQSSFGQS